MKDVRPLVRIVKGQVQGVIERSINGKRYAAFKGIPYAKPPIGKLRFQDPVPVEPWSHVKDASKFGLNCAQLDPITRTTVGSDDCLYLNVYTPSHETSQSYSKPVMFWIHGGSFAYGSGDDTLYGPDYIIEKDVILITINYRLNVLGFLNLEDEETTGNQGLKDQVLALKWVQENITNFGGNPKNVTIFGESAGASSVHYLTLSPLAKGLFHKAILQSGVAINPWANTPESPKLYAQNLARALGKDIYDSKILVEFLRSIDAQKLAEVDAKISAEVIRQGFRYFIPSCDVKSKNPFLPISVKTASSMGGNVPYLMGHTSHEGILFLTGVTDEKFDMYNTDFEKLLSPGMMKLLRDRELEASDLRKIYFGDKPVSKETRHNYMELHTDIQFVCGIHEIAAMRASRKECPTYFYKFSYDNGKSLIKNNYGLDMPGVCHADDLPYILYPKLIQLLGIPPAEPGTTEKLVIERVTEMWTNFAKTGNPTPTVSDTLPIIWKPLKNPDNLECLNIGEDLRMETVKNVNKLYVKQSTSKL